MIQRSLIKVLPGRDFVIYLDISMIIESLSSSIDLE